MNTRQSQHAAHGYVYLTFDDGPDAQWTPRILDVLAAGSAKATFFMIGASARRCPSLVRRIVAEGHTVGNHTLSHRHPWTMRAASARAEVREGGAAIADVAGAAPRFFRPPHGRRRPCMTLEALRAGQALTMWDRSAIDWGMLGSFTGIARRLRRVAPAEVVLMHDGRNIHNRPDQLLAVLPGFLRDLASRDIHCIALNESKPLRAG